MPPSNALFTSDGASLDVAIVAATDVEQRTTDSLLVSHPAAPGSIRSVSNNLYSRKIAVLRIAKIYQQQLKAEKK